VKTTRQNDERRALRTQMRTLAAKIRKIDHDETWSPRREQSASLYMAMLRGAADRLRELAVCSSFVLFLCAAAWLFLVMP